MFPFLVRYGNIWHPEELQSHLRIFPQGQFVAVEPDDTVVGSAITLIVSLDPEYAEHTWKEITADGYLQTTILKATAYMGQIFPLIQNTDMKA